MTTLSEELVHSTVRIETRDEAGNQFTGTGFFFNFQITENQFARMVVTNRHVLEGMVSAAVHVTRADDAGNPLYGQQMRVTVANLQRRTFFHPAEDVDLALLVIADTFNEIERSGHPLYTRSVLAEHLASEHLIQSLGMFEEVLMIGYPNSLWDDVNNLPIVRRGITATPFIRNFKGREEFVIDAACFPGSSGSPIYLYNNGGYRNAAGVLASDVRFALLGILYAGPQHNVEGEIVVESIPTATRQVPLSRIPMNLGFCIKSHRVLDFAPELTARITEYRNSPEYRPKDYRIS